LPMMALVIFLFLLWLLFGGLSRQLDLPQSIRRP